MKAHINREKELEKEVEFLKNENRKLKEMLILTQKGKFGKSSEQTPKENYNAQLNFFNEAEAISEAAEPSDSEEPVVKSEKGYKARARKSRKEKLLKDVPVVIIDCTIPEKDRICGECGSELAELGKEYVREDFEYVPAHIKIRRYFQTSYHCKCCKKKGTTVIVKAGVPASVLNHSLASASSVANVMYQKYVNAMPLYRQEKEWERTGIELSRGTMANWIIRCSESWLEPVVKRFRCEQLQQAVIHSDETPVQVLKEDGRRAETKSYMWVYRSGKYEERQIALYDYSTSRSGEIPAGYLKGFNKYLHTDGYAGYNKVPDVTRCSCWAHARRYFVEAMEVTPKLNADEKTPAEIGVEYCDKLFFIERQLEDLTPEKRYEERLKLEKPVLDAFWSWLEKLETASGFKFDKAVKYVLKLKCQLENYLLDGRCNISNNIAENAIRPFVIGRKNWLFCDTVKGAKASACVYSIVETAKANGLDPYKYLEFLLKFMPSVDFYNNPELLDQVVPWSEMARIHCK